MTIFRDIESGEKITLDQLEKEFYLLKLEDPESYDYNFDGYVNNCLTRNNGTLEIMAH